MGRMKDVYMEIMNANDYLPKDITIADIARMKELEMYNWEQYEKYQEKERLQKFQSDNKNKIAKTTKTIKKFSSVYDDTKEK